VETNNQVSDFDLVNRFVDGDKSAMQVLVNRHRNKVYTYIYLTVKNQQLAEDIFQDTFIKVIKSLLLNKYQDNGKFVSWVMRIAHNLVIDHFRHQKQLNVVSTDKYESDLLNRKDLVDGTIEDGMVYDQVMVEVRQLVHLLPQEQREVVMMRYFSDMSFKEIADQTEVSINTALGRMRYALINLRRLIKEKELNLSI
jgi:RNA polymerase sigma-70 factor (ECF subfamily)